MQYMTLSKGKGSSKEDHINKIFFRFCLSVLVLCTSAGLFWTVAPGHKELKIYIASQLTQVTFDSEHDEKEPISSDAVIYVLGGTQKSLEEKFKIVAKLCNKNPCRKILLFSAPGITVYDPSLGRNLTNDEWAIKHLIGLGAKRERLEQLSFKKGLFGTLTEAEGLADIATQRNYKRIILVTSQYHTKRTWITFSRIFENRNIALSIYAANDPVRLRSLLYEYLKLVLYKNIVLPYYTEQKPSVTWGVVNIAVLV